MIIKLAHLPAPACGYISGGSRAFDMMHKHHIKAVALLMVCFTRRQHTQSPHHNLSLSSSREHRLQELYPYSPVCASSPTCCELSAALYFNTKLEPADSFLRGSHVHDQAIAPFLSLSPNLPLFLDWPMQTMMTEGSYAQPH